MASKRTEKAVKNLLTSTSRTEAMEKANFSPSYARTGQILKTKGWQELMEKYFPDKTLAQVHKEGLAATKKQFRNNNKTGEIEEVAEEPDYAVRHKYLDTGYKLKGRYVEPDNEDKTFGVVIINLPEQNDNVETAGQTKYRVIEN